MSGEFERKQRKRLGLLEELRQQRYEETRDPYEVGFCAVCADELTEGWDVWQAPESGEFLCDLWCAQHHAKEHEEEGGLEFYVKYTLTKEDVNL